MDNPRIFLDMDEPVLIVEYPTGVRYSGQVGGLACLHPEVEGFLVFPRFGRDGWEPLAGISCPDGCYGGHLGEDAAREIDQVLQACAATYTRWWMRFDHDRRGESTEAWFPVVTTRTEHEYGSDLDTGLIGKRGWLLMPDNCD